MPTKKFNRESVLKGEILWRRIHNAYSEQTELAHQNSAPFTGSMQLFSRRKATEEKTVSVNVFSDGAGLGNYKSRTGKGLTGYGYGFIGFQDGKVFVPTTLRGEYKYGPATIAEAEALGALKGVIHAKKSIIKKGGGTLKINLTTDCLNLIESLHDVRNAVIKKIDDFLNTPEEMRGTYVKNKYKTLLIIRDLANELFNDPLVESVTTHWVKGHILDSTPINELRYIEDYLNYKISESKSPGESQKFKDEKLLFHNMRNNKMVDKMALEGAVRGLTKRIDYLARKDCDSARKESEAFVTSISLMNSVSARMIAIDYIAGKSSDYLDETTIKCLLGDKGPSEIERKKEKLCLKYKCKRDNLPSAIVADHKGSFDKVVIGNYLGGRESSFVKKYGSINLADACTPT